MKLVQLASVFALIAHSVVSAQEADTPPRPVHDQAPTNFVEMWAGFDPRAEPLEVETFKEWEQGDVVFRIVRFRIGIFNGKKATLAAIYGFPKRVIDSGERLPGIVQIHGGGQYADYNACLTNAKRGYATVSIAWAGRINAPGYRELSHLTFKNMLPDAVATLSNPIPRRVPDYSARPQSRRRSGGG